MAISRRQFNTVMMAAMGSMLTRRALAQAAPGAGDAAASVPPFPTVPGPVAAGPIAQLQRQRLHAIDDLHLDAAGGDPQGNLDKITDAMVRLYQQVHDGVTQGGEIYFPQGTFAIHRPIRPLPDIAFVGESAQGSVLKNTSTDGEAYWNAEIIFAGHDQPSEALVGKFPYRPFTADPKLGDRHVMVKAEDYDQVNVGDEIKVIGATNAPETNGSGLKVMRPNHLVKVNVIGKKAVGSDRILEIDRPIPWDLPSGGVGEWGTLRNVPVWMIVKEWYVQALEYWQQKGQHGFDTYTAKLGPQWGMGWSSRRNYFKDITLWSRSGMTMVRGMPCDSVFDNCILKGSKCFYGNTFQYSQINDCTLYFTDQAFELSFNCLFCNFKNTTAIHDPSLNIKSFTQAMALLNLNERSSGMLFDGLTLQAASRTMSPRNKGFKISGSDNHFRHVRVTLPDIGDIIRVNAHNDTGRMLSPDHVTFRDMKIDLGGKSYGRFMALDNESNNITFAGVEVTAAAGKTVCDMVNEPCHDINFIDTVIPGSLNMTKPVKNVTAERCNFSGGIKGEYANTVAVTPGQPDFARWA